MTDLGRLLLMLVLVSTAGAVAAFAAPPDTDQRARALLQKMTLEEKLDYIGGWNDFYIRAIPRLGLPELRMADGPIGVRNVGPSTAYAAGIALAASWDPALADRVGTMLGKDARARGVHFLLGPGVNIYRTPLCGRNFEYFGEDPFLASRMAVGYINGVQSQGVSATVKHFMGNNSELNRHHTSSDIDERTMREIYLPTFEAAVREAQVGALMNSYNLINGVHATQHDYLNNQVAKREWGFDGILMSDWMSTYDGVAAANGGLDLEMPSGKLMNRATLAPAIKDGRVALATIDDKVLRILRTAIRFGWLDRPQTDATWPLYAEAGRALALETALDSMVLLKNQDGMLPLDKRSLKSVALIGPDAYPAVPVGGGSAQVRPFVAVSYLEGISGYLAGQATVAWNRGLLPLREIFDGTPFVTATSGGKPGLVGEYFANLELSGAPIATRTDTHIHYWGEHGAVWPTQLDPTSFSARFTGFFVPTSSGDHRLSISSYGLDGYRLFIDGKKVLDRGGQPQPIQHALLKLQAGKAYAIKLEYVHFDHHANLGFGIRKLSDLIAPEAKQLAAQADVAIVLAGFDPSNEGEGQDRTFQLPSGQDELIAAVRNANPNTIVVVSSGGAVDMSRWVDGTRAIVQAWYAGQEAGRALPHLLFGDVSPSGKLPVTFERRLEDNASFPNYLPDARGRIPYREGVFLGYRHFDRLGKRPLFPFGHGLSYTQFGYGRLAVTPPTHTEGSVTVSFNVTNQGRRAGAEVAQVYVGDRHAPVPRPPKELKGFAKVKLAPGESKRVEIALDRRAFSYYDEPLKTWRVAPGEFDILVGSSSQQIELRGTVTVR